MVDGSVHEIRNVLRKIALCKEKLKNRPEYKEVMPLIKKYSGNLNHISEKEVKRDLERAEEILERIQQLGLDEYGYQ